MVSAGAAAAHLAGRAGDFARPGARRQRQRPQAHRRERAEPVWDERRSPRGQRIGPGDARGGRRERACRARSARARVPAPTGDRRDAGWRVTGRESRHSRIASWSPSRSSTRYRPGVSDVMRCDSLKTSVVDAGSSRPAPAPGRRTRAPDATPPPPTSSTASRRRGRPPPPAPSAQRRPGRARDVGRAGERDESSGRARGRPPPPRLARGIDSTTATSPSARRLAHTHSPMATTPASAPGPFVAAMRSGGVTRARSGTTATPSARRGASALPVNTRRDCHEHDGSEPGRDDVEGGRAAPAAPRAARGSRGRRRLPRARRG